jgi:TonB family protein
MKSPAAIVACLSGVLAFAAACTGPANPRPNAATLDPADTTVIWDYRDVTREPELLNRGEAARAIGQSYPPSLRAQGITGNVTLDVVTSRTGSVESVRVVNATDPLFGDAAREVALRMRFQPAMVRGIAVRCRFTLPITFDLQR